MASPSPHYPGSLKTLGRGGRAALPPRDDERPPGKLPWATVARAYSRFKLPISKARRAQMLLTLDPLDVDNGKPAPKKPPMRERKFGGDQEPLSKIPFKIMKGHEGAVTSCHFCVDDTRLLTSSYDHTVKLWDAVNGVVIRNFEPQPRAPVLECSITADSRRIVAASYDKTIRAWDLETGKLLWEVSYDNFIVTCKFSPDGKYVVSGLDVDYGICIMDAENATTVSYLKDHHKKAITACCFDPDSQKVASVSSDKSIKIWDVTSQATLLTITKFSQENTDAKSLSVTGQGWLHGYANYGVIGHFLCTSSWDKTLKVWNVHTGEFRNYGACATLMQGHEGSVSSCSFSRDSSLLVSGGFDKTVAIWDVGEGYQKLSLKGHSDWVMDVAISSNKKWILSASKDSTMRLWHIEEIDEIPLVREYKKAKGFKFTQCKGCDRSFSIYESDSSTDLFTECVFCRLDAKILSAEASASLEGEDLLARKDSRCEGDMAAGVLDDECGPPVT